jgi:hypothetical protein
VRAGGGEVVRRSGRRAFSSDLDATRCSGRGRFRRAWRLPGRSRRT